MSRGAWDTLTSTPGQAVAAHVAAVKDERPFGGKIEFCGARYSRESAISVAYLVRSLWLAAGSDKKAKGTIEEENGEEKDPNKKPFPIPAFRSETRPWPFQEPLDVFAHSNKMLPCARKRTSKIDMSDPGVGMVSMID